jgi:NitT/TauT family transport system permease protein
LKNIFTNKNLQSWLWLLVLILLWELAARLGFVNAYILPAFSKVYDRFLKELFKGTLGLQTLNSMKIILMGFLLSFGIAVLITLLCDWVSQFESLFNTLSTIMSPLPSVAVMPLVIMWFGIGTGAMMVLIVHGVLWALVRHMLDGLRSIPQVYREWGRNIGLSPRQMFTGILIFAIMPEFIAGVRVGWGRAWRALISAEMVFGMIGSLGGLGFYIYTNRAYANLTNVMAGVIVICLIGILMESVVFKQIEKRTVQKWGMSRE